MAHSTTLLDASISSEDHRRPRRRIPGPLAAILAVQACLSLLLAVSNTAFEDETLYIWAGHVELAQWLHGAHVVVSPFTKYLSGAPQIYPPLAALADSAGGLVGARILSLAFMLTTTCLLWSAAHRLSGRRAAVICCALWLACESNLRMGAYATYDPMAIFCVCLALWLVILAADSEQRYGELAGLSALVMALGCVTAYSYAIYIPVVLVIGFLATARTRSLKRAVILVSAMTVILAIALAVVPSLLGVWPGVFDTTLSRSITRDNQTVPAILQIAWSSAGAFTVIVSAGALIAVGTARERSKRFLLAALLAAAFVVPCYQILIARTGWALDKHLTPGMWCAALVAGIGFAGVALPGLRAGAQAAAALTALSLPLFAGWYSAYGITRSWAGSGSLAAAVRPLAASVHGNAYTEITPSLLDYYSWPASLDQLRWKSSITLDPPGQPGTWAAYYRHELAVQKPAVAVLWMPGVMKAQSLPADVLSVLRKKRGTQATLGELAGDTMQTPGLYAFAETLQTNRAYRLAATGPYNTGYGSFSATPGTFMVWQRTPER
jgi:4-amino-4-deoxy-L-arabinose transferase-like glycosyltransferase